MMDTALPLVRVTALPSQSLISSNLMEVYVCMYLCIYLWMCLL
jgi:hypothetical protein